MTGALTSILFHVGGRSGILSAVPRMCLLTAVAIGILGGQESFAGGFEINEQSARAMAMGGAITASTDIPAALYVNPAVLSFLNGVNFSLGATVMVPYYQFTGPDPSTTVSKMQPQAVFPPNVYLTYSPGSNFAVGLSASTPYSVMTQWNSDWPGRRVALNTRFRALFITPAIAFQPSPSLSIGFGINIIASSVLLSNTIGLDTSISQEGTGTYQGDTRFDYGFQVGLTYRLSDVLAFGLAYQSKAKIDISDGTAVFENLPAQLAPTHPNSEAATTLNTPDNIHAGVSVHIGQTLIVLADLQYTFWSQFKSLSISFKNHALQDIVLPENWKDAYTGRLGMELGLPGIAIRAGVFFDQSPIPDAYLRPTVPDADKVGYSLGIGYSVGGSLSLDFAILYYKLADRRVTNSDIQIMGQPFNGTYTGSATVFGLNVSYNWN